MILVTGGAGYIGSHCVLKLLEKNTEVAIFDNFSTGHKETVEKLKKYGKLELIEGDLVNFEDINNAFKKDIEAVIHFAALSRVEESVLNPQKYYINNVLGTINLLEAMLKNNVKKIVFSSSAAVYGATKCPLIKENHPLEPINPYGTTKLIIEKILDDYDKAYDLKSVRLRYFNAVGADSRTRIGEWHALETHLVPNILKSIFEKDKTFNLYGNDYATKDGTPIRDYINVEDLILAHVLALDYLNSEGKTDYFNLGTGLETTVGEVFDLCQKITGKKIKVNITARREGDPERLCADNSRAKAILGWRIEKTLSDSIKSAYEWEKVLQNKKNV